MCRHCPFSLFLPYLSYSGFIDAIEEQRCIGVVWLTVTPLANPVPDCSRTLSRFILANLSGKQQLRR